MTFAIPLAAALRDPRARFLAAATAVYALGAVVLRAAPGFDHPERIAAARSIAELAVTSTAGRRMRYSISSAGLALSWPQFCSPMRSTRSICVSR